MLSEDFQKSNHSGNKTLIKSFFIGFRFFTFSNGGGRNCDT